jgi:hypothetical protein
MLFEIVDPDLTFHVNSVIKAQAGFNQYSTTLRNALPDLLATVYYWVAEGGKAVEARQFLRVS